MKKKKSKIDRDFCAFFFKHSWTKISPSPPPPKKKKKKKNIHKHTTKYGSQ